MIPADILYLIEKDYVFTKLYVAGYFLNLNFYGRESYGCYRREVTKLKDKTFSSFCTTIEPVREIYQFNFHPSYKEAMLEILKAIFETDLISFASVLYWTPDTGKCEIKKSYRSSQPDDTIVYYSDYLNYIKELRKIKVRAELLPVSGVIFEYIIEPFHKYIWEKFEKNTGRHSA